MYKFTVSQTNIDQASKAIQTLKEQFDTLNASAKEARENLDTNGGMTAIDRMNAELAGLEAQKEQARNVARQTVKEARDSFFASIDQQAALDGSQLGADYPLLTGNLVRTERELQVLADKHAENPAMRHAIAQYAEGKGWNHFEDFTTERAVRDYGDYLFAQAELAATDPNTIAGILMRNPSAIVEAQRNLGLLD